MDERLREPVRQRVGNRCEYCLIPQEATPYFTFHVEHVIPRQHAGDTDDPRRLALACNRCNAYKGPNLSSIDPATGEVVRLFNPREDTWQEHFVFEGSEVIGITLVGRATVNLLRMNAPHRVELRGEWLAEGGTLA